MHCTLALPTTLPETPSLQPREQGTEGLNLLDNTELAGIIGKIGGQRIPKCKQFRALLCIVSLQTLYLFVVQDTNFCVTHWNPSSLGRLRFVSFSFSCRNNKKRRKGKRETQAEGRRKKNSLRMSQFLRCIFYGQGDILLF